MTIALNRFRHDAANGTAFSSVRFFANVYYFFLDLPRLVYYTRL